ncbi:hypothetical protein [Roseovarius sp. MMSF_3281]|uniref:hypothetical protein n=1 Tax=Roseovarius sp. MMSF_3281 TaxID=3046694 RepID=UPI00273E8C9E|nr:hypothetical protein [Roseovarius sp. MMSF_3281]
MTGSPLTRIAHVYSTSEAALTIAALEGAGFDVFVPGYHTHNTVPHISVALGGMPVLIENHRASEAREFLAALDKPAAKAEAEEQDEDAADDDTTRPASRSWLYKLVMLVVYFLTGTAPPLNARFTDPPEDES